MRIPVEYLANLLTAGRTEPVTLALERMLAMRAYMRAKTVDGVIDERIAERVGLSGRDIEEMYQLMAIANYEDRFVIPTAHRETGEDAFQLRGSCGFSFGEGCSRQDRLQTCSTRKKPEDPDGGGVMARSYRALAALISYPTEALQAATGEIATVLAEEGMVAGSAARRLRSPAGRTGGSDIYDLQERYFALFDRSRTLVAASLRACAWREPRSRPGHGGSDRALSQPWAGADRRRAAGLPAAVPGVPLAAA